HVPSQYNLCRCLAVLFSEFPDDRIIEERPAFKRRPRFKLYIVFITKGPHFLLGELWVIFQLVDHGSYRCNTEYFLKMLSVEVAYANRPHPAVFIQLFQGSPGICILPFNRPVDEVKVEI